METPLQVYFLMEPLISIYTNFWNPPVYEYDTLRWWSACVVGNDAGSSRNGLEEQDARLGRHARKLLGSIYRNIRIYRPLGPGCMIEGLG